MIFQTGLEILDATILCALPHLFLSSTKIHNMVAWGGHYDGKDKHPPSQPPATTLPPDWSYPSIGTYSTLFFEFLEILDFVHRGTNMQAFYN